MGWARAGGQRGSRPPCTLSWPGGAGPPTLGSSQDAHRPQPDPGELALGQGLQTLREAAWARLTCCAGHTSRSGGPGTPGTAHTTCTAHSSPRAPASPGGGPLKSGSPPDTGSPRLRPSLCLIHSRVTPVLPKSGHADLPLCRQERARETALSVPGVIRSLLPCCAPTFPREPQAPVLSREVGGPAHPDLGRSQGGVTAGARAGGQRRRQLPGGTEAWPHLLLPLPGVSRRGRGQRWAPGRLGRSSTARGLEEAARPEPGARDPGRSPSNASPQPGGIHQAFIPRGAQSVREEVRRAGEPPQLLGRPPASLSWHTGTGGQG